MNGAAGVEPPSLKLGRARSVVAAAERTALGGAQAAFAEGFGELGRSLKSGGQSPRHFKKWSGKRDSNPRLRPWQGRTLPLSYSRPARPDSVHNRPHAGQIEPPAAVSSGSITRSSRSNGGHGRELALGDPGLETHWCRLRGLRSARGRRQGGCASRPRGAVAKR